MKKSLLILLLSIIALGINAQTMNPSNHIVYVKAAGTGDGSSWSSAANLADALKWAHLNKDNNLWTSVSPLQIWVAVGTHFPKYTPDDNQSFSETPTDLKDKSFLMVNDVQLYGGFDPDSGIDDLTKTRIFPSPSETNKGSILSGDLGVPNSINDNAYHTLVSTDNVGVALLDGFSVIGGNAQGAGIFTVNGKTIFRSNGGGMIVVDSSPTIQNTVFQSNTGTYGGAIYIDKNSSTPKFINTVFTKNSATQLGGAICSDHSSYELINCNITNNKAAVGGALRISASDSKPKIYNSIIWGNTKINDSSTDNIANYSAADPMFQYNIIQGSGGSAAWIASTGTDGGNNLDATPNFVNSTTFNYNLKPGSIAISSGNNSIYPNLNSTSKDLAGRNRLQKGTIDLGAYESIFGKVEPDAAGIVYVKKNSSGTGSSWTNGIEELADALAAAASNTFIKEIWVAQGKYTPRYSPEDGLNFADSASLPANRRRIRSFVLVPNVKIYGGFAGTETTLNQRELNANQSVLSGDFDDDGYFNNGNHLNNAVNIVISAGNVGTATLNGFTIVGGYGNRTPVDDFLVNNKGIATYAGAGIFIAESNPELANLIVKNNYVIGSGGGININNSSTVLKNILIHDNRADQNGGGIQINNNEPMLINTTIVNNYAHITGGGIRNYNASPSIHNSIIFNNSQGGTDNIGNYSSPKVYYSIVETYYVNSWLGINTTYSNSLQNINPKFTDVNNKNFRLMSDSPAINAGDPNTNSTAPGTIQVGDIDIEGTPRILDSSIDMGAFEYQSLVVLPVNLTSFKAIKQASQVFLKWQTAKETKNNGFIITRSSDNVQFNEIARITGYGTSNQVNNYSIIDKSPLNGYNYYRLQQQDNDGKIQDLGLQVVDFSLNENLVEAYPNPSTNSVNLAFAANLFKKLLVVDITGRILQQQKLPNNVINYTLDMDKLPSGIYFVKLSGISNSKTIKIIKQ